MLGGPPATAVAIGPFSATPVFANRLNHAGLHEIRAAPLELARGGGFFPFDVDARGREDLSAQLSTLRGRYRRQESE